MKIQNNKSQVSTTELLNEKDYLDRLLTKLKDLVKGYAAMITEASNENLVKEYKKTLDTYIRLQREVFEIMFQKGWYQLETVEDKKIKEKLQMLETEFNQLSELDV